MANGKPGDHPYTDIIVHGSSHDFGQELSDKVRELARLPGFHAVSDEVANILWECAPPWNSGGRGRVGEACERIAAIEARLRGSS